MYGDMTHAGCKKIEPFTKSLGYVPPKIVMLVYFNNKAKLKPNFEA